MEDGRAGNICTLMAAEAICSLFVKTIFSLLPEAAKAFLSTSALEMPGSIYPVC